MPRGKPGQLIALRVDSDLVAQLDKARGAQTRTAWIVEAIANELEGRTPKPQTPRRNVQSNSLKNFMR